MKISSNTQLNDLNKTFYKPELDMGSNKVIHIQIPQFKKYMAINSEDFERMKKYYIKFTQKDLEIRSLLNSKKELSVLEAKKVHGMGESLQILFEKFWVQFIILGVKD